MSYQFKSQSGGGARRSSGGRSNFRGGYRGNGSGNSNNRGRSRSNGGGKREFIDHTRFVKAASPREEVAYTPTHQFSDFALNDVLQQNLIARGFTTPSPIQDQAIPAALEGRDVIGIASTGTGKTTAFGLPLLVRLMNNRREKALVIAPTRELAQQIEAEFRLLAKGSGLVGVVLIGGSSMGLQLRDLRGNPNVIIGTPGRIKDHLERGSLSLNNASVVVLDEVDRMLDMGFVNDVTEILEHTPSERQSFFFSATIDNRVRSLIDRFTTNPVNVTLQASSASDNVHQDVVRFHDHADKIDKLHDILINPDTSKAIVFDETQRGVERIYNELRDRGFSADAIHGGKSQGQRQRALAKFKRNDVNILVATDVAARGIDVADITHVINYSIPKVYDDYVHRIGRAGRAGRIGYALTFVEHRHGR